VQPKDFSKRLSLLTARIVSNFQLFSCTIVTGMANGESGLLFAIRKFAIPVYPG